MNSTAETSNLRRTMDEWLNSRIKKPTQPHCWSQFNVMAEEIGEKVLAESMRLGETEGQFCCRMSDAYDILWSTRYVLNIHKSGRETDQDQKEHTVWFRKNPKDALYQSYESESFINFDEPALWDKVATYMERPWLQRSFLEWVFVDAMIYLEVCQFGNAIKRDIFPGKRDFLGRNVAYWKTEGDLEKMKVIYLKIQLIRDGWKFALGIVFPIVIVLCLLYFGKSWLAAVGSFSFAFSFILYMIIRIGILTYRRLTGWKDPVTKAMELWTQMANVYELVKGPIINPIMLRDALLKTKELGAIWPQAIYSLVERIIARDPTAWVVSERYAYKPF
jgi:hypothetical protein